MSMIPNRAPGSIWCLKRDDFKTYVRTEVNDIVVIAGGYPEPAGRLAMSRADARLLAKRINQCLDATVKR